METAAAYCNIAQCTPAQLKAQSEELGTIPSLSRTKRQDGIHSYPAWRSALKEIVWRSSQ